MRFFLFALLLTSFTAHASPFMSMKERLRLHLWFFGIEEKPVVKKKEEIKRRPLLEEIERPLRKI